METVLLKRTDEKDIFDLCQKVFLPPYNITRQDILYKYVQDETVVHDASFAVKDNGKLVGLVISKYINSSAFKEQGFISLLATDPSYRHLGIASSLLQKALENLSCRQILVGMEPRNFFSGIPHCQNNALRFFSKHNFTINPQEHYDLLTTLTLNHYIQNYKPHCHDCTFTIYTGDLSTLKTFIRNELYARWAEEIDDVYNNDKKRILVALKDGIVAMCVLDMQYHGRFGMLGVAKKLRGKGIGKELLYYGLKYMEERYIEDVIVDWTVLKTYYGQFGFVPYRTYSGAWRNV